MKPGGANTGFLESFAHAAAGVAETARGRNFRVQAGFGVAAIVLGFALGITPAEWLAIVVCIGLVLGGECLNTALEAVVDIASPQLHPLAKRAKDAAAGSVLLFSVAALFVAAIVFLPRMVAMVA